MFELSHGYLKYKGLCARLPLKKCSGVFCVYDQVNYADYSTIIQIENALDFPSLLTVLEDACGIVKPFMLDK